MRCSCSLTAALLVLSVQGTALAETIDFNSAVEPGIGIGTIVIGSVSITRLGGEDLWLQDHPTEFPPGTPNPLAGYGRSLVGYNLADSQWIATFAVPVTMVSIDLGDYGTDSETVYLKAFDATNNQIDMVELFLPDDFIGMATLSLTAADIKSIQFGTSTGIGGIYADNLVFSPVPIPAVLPMFAAAVGLLGFLGWRARCRSVVGV